MFIRGCVAVLAVVVGAAVFARADDAEIKKVAKAKAEELQAALLKGDYGKVADLTHPKTVELLGGKEKMVAYLAQETKAMKDKGYGLKSTTVAEPSDPLAAGGDLYLTVPFKLEMTVPGGRLQTQSGLIGVSGDGGKTWTFVNVKPGREKLLNLLPNLPEKLPFPKKEPFTFIKD